MNTIRNKHNGITSKPGTLVHVKGNYVTQYITIQSGCHVCFTPDGGIREEKQQEMEPPPAIPQADAPLSRIELAFQTGIKAVLDAGLIQNKQDFRAIHRIMEEMNLYDRFSFRDFIMMLKRVPSIPEEHAPSTNNLKSLTFGSHYPNWKVSNGTPDKIQRLVYIAKVFKDTFYAVLQSH